LSYYTDPAEPYFPRNRINLQYAISADVVENKRKTEDETTFIVTTDERTYRFKADSAVSAKEWTRSIQKVIFRTHNEGNSVKISLPIQNVLEIEESSILDFADTVKVRVIDNDETFAIDEVGKVSFTRFVLTLTTLVLLLVLQQRSGRAQRSAHHDKRQRTSSACTRSQ
jgi:sterol 3beta-glucosyltransferase